MQRICASLQEAGFDVLLVGRLRKRSVPLARQPFRQKRLRCLFEKGFLFYAEFNLRLFGYLLFTRCDVVSSVDADTLLPCTLVSRIRSKKLVFDAHEYFTEVPELAGRPVVKRIWQKILNYGIARSAACYTVGPALAGLFSAQYQKSFRVICNMPLAREAVHTERKDKLVLYQGDLNEGRGLPETIEAVKGTGAMLWIAGDGPVRPLLEKLVAEQGMERQVRFLGRLLPDALREVTQQASLGINVLDARSESYRYSLANKFFDYVQAGVPVLCADFAEYRALNEQFEVAVLCPNEPGAIAAALHRLFSDKFFYRKLADNCKLASRHWNWQSQEPQLLDIYRSVLT